MNQPETLFIRIGWSIMCGLAIGATYIYLNSKRGYSRSFFQSLVIANVTCSLVVGEVLSIRIDGSQALAFALVGMLGLLRFRAALRETQEFNYLLLSISSGAAIGSSAAFDTLIACFFCLSFMVISSAVVPMGDRRNLKIKMASTADIGDKINTVLPRIVANHMIILSTIKNDAEYRYIVEANMIGDLSASELMGYVLSNLDVTQVAVAVGDSGKKFETDE